MYFYVEHIFLFQNTKYKTFDHIYHKFCYLIYLVLVYNIFLKHTKKVKKIDKKEKFKLALYFKTKR